MWQYSGGPLPFQCPGRGLLPASCSRHAVLLVWLLVAARSPRPGLRRLRLPSPYHPRRSTHSPWLRSLPLPFLLYSSWSRGPLPAVFQVESGGGLGFAARLTYHLSPPCPLVATSNHPLRTAFLCWPKDYVLALKEIRHRCKLLKTRLSFPICQPVIL